MMFKKKYVLGIVILLVVMLAAAGVSLLGPMDFLGLDFTDGFVIKVDIKEAFEEEEIYSVLSAYKSEIGDWRVQKAGDDMEQAVIYVQHADEALAKGIVEKVADKYENAVFRGFASERNYTGFSPLFQYTLIFLLAAAFVCAYLAVRQNLASGVGALLAILFGMVSAVCLCALVAVPIGTASFLGAMGTAFLSAALLLTLVNGRIKEEAYKADVKLEEGDLSLIMKEFAIKGGIAAIVALVFLALLVIFGSTPAKGFAVSLAAGGITGVFSAYMIGAPLTWEIIEKGKAARLRPKKKVRVIR